MFDGSINTIEGFFLTYACIVTGSYFLQAALSFINIKSYLNKKEFLNEKKLLESEILPSIVLIAPAYNEAKVIAESVRSLLTVHYFNMELVIVNDGSKDNTLEILIENFDLVPHEQRAYHNIKTKDVKAAYRSTNQAFKNLLVIDKVNGRKADAINVGINHAYGDYYAVIDLDCLLEPNALLMMIEPILQEQEKKVVAVGGVIGAANDAIIKHGKFLEAKAPDKFLPRIQIIEYIRAFIMSRPAWSQINGLLLISGAFGIFERETLISVGGYSHDSIGEDMDLVMKIHQYCHENKVDYKVGFIPFPLCWTEVPDNHKILSSQRNRWMRGTIECMVKYKKMCFNPKYGIVGMISYPYWFVSEMMAPLIELIGIVVMAYFAIMGIISWKYFFMLFVIIYLIAVTHSFLSILVFYLNYEKYNSTSDLLKLFKAAALEPILYHPNSLKWSMRGYYDFFFNKNLGWGKMVRSGFNVSPKT